MPKLDGKFVKEYFKKGKFPESWEPEVESRWVTKYDKYLFMQERDDVIKILQPKGKHILEVGTGKGRFAIELARNGAKVTAIDISQEMLKIASKRAKEQGFGDKIFFEEADAEDLKYCTNSFDAAMCIQTLMHIPNKSRCVSELARVVKPNGVIVVDDINKDHRWRIAVRGRKNFVKAVMMDIYESTLCLPLRYVPHIFFKIPLNPVAVSRTTQREFTEVVKKMGLKIDQFINYGPDYCPVYFLIVARKNGRFQERVRHSS